MGKVSAAQYEAYRAQMKAKLGVQIEASKAGATGSTDYLGGFNRISENEKQEIAETFDSKLDLQLQADLAKVMKACGINRYIDLVQNQKAVKMLKEMGICVQSLDKSGKPKTPKNGDRNWLISRVDKDGNIIKDDKGGLAQFKMKDFNSDSYIQNCELYVNDLLKVAGYDCVSSLDLSPEELAQIASLSGSSSGVGLGGNQSGNTSSLQIKQLQDMLLKQMIAQLDRKVDPLTGDAVKEDDAEEDSDSREKVSKIKFENLVEELMDKNKTEDGKATISRESAEEIIGEEYVIDLTINTVSL